MTEVDFKDLSKFDKKKRLYFSHFAKNHHDSFYPHFYLGKTLGKGLDVWRNTGEHCLVAGVFADLLADKLRFAEDRRKMVVKAAILHDWDKPRESAMISEAIKLGTLTLDTIKKIKLLDSQDLRTLGYSYEVVALTGANTPETIEGPTSVEEKVIWYIDAMLSGTKVVSIDRRFSDLERGWDGEKENPLRAKRNCLMSKLFQQKFNGISMYRLQRNLGLKIGQEFSEMLGFRGDPDILPNYLITLLNIKIEKVSPIKVKSH